MMDTTTLHNLDDEKRSYTMEKFIPLRGRKIVRVELRDQKEKIAFVFEDGEKLYAVEGDCCSKSWIEHLEMPSNLAGAQVIAVGESYTEITDEYNAPLIEKWKAEHPGQDIDAWSIDNFEECLSTRQLSARRRAISFWSIATHQTDTTGAILLKCKSYQTGVSRP